MGYSKVVSEMSLWNGDNVAQIFRKYKLLYKGRRASHVISQHFL
jgi:hypothetical protein